MAALPLPRKGRGEKGRAIRREEFKLNEGMNGVCPRVADMAPPRTRTRTRSSWSHVWPSTLLMWHSLVGCKHCTVAGAHHVFADMAHHAKHAQEQEQEARSWSRFGRPFTYC